MLGRLAMALPKMRSVVTRNLGFFSRKMSSAAERMPAQPPASNKFFYSKNTGQKELSAEEQLAAAAKRHDEIQEMMANLYMENLKRSEKAWGVGPK